ncbi:MAG: exo-alpha-sialidase [Deltaproteobacteria bacterium]|nr:exo-alpha-sialidase [Deltaproteobacteria bacterium]
MPAEAAMERMSPNPVIDLLRQGLHDASEGKPTREAEAVRSHFPELVDSRVIARRFFQFLSPVPPLIASYQALQARVRGAGARRGVGARRAVSAPTGGSRPSSTRYRVVLDSFQRLDASREALPSADAIFAAWVGISPLASEGTRSGITRVARHAEQGRRRTFKPSPVVLYEGSAPFVGVAVDLWRKDGDASATTVTDFMARVASFYEQEIAPVLAQAAAVLDEFADIPVTGAAAAPAAEAMREFDLALQTIWSWIRDAWSAILNFFGFDNGRIGTWAETLAPERLAGVDPGSAVALDTTLRGDGGAYRLQVSVGRLSWEKFVSPSGTDAPLTLASDQERLYLAWTGRSADHEVVVQSRRAYDNPEAFHAIRPGAGEHGSPGLAFYDGEMVAAWAPGQGPLRGMAIVVSRSADCGASWSEPAPILAEAEHNLGISINHGMTLCAAGRRLYLAWQGWGYQRGERTWCTRPTINLMWTDDGERWSERWELDETSRSRPALAAHAGGLLLAWVGTDDEHGRLNVARLVPDERRLGDRRVLGERCLNGPALAVRGDRVHLGWVGTDRRINLSRFEGWPAQGHKVTLDETATSGLALLTHGGHLFVAWNGTDARHSVNLLPYL